MILFQKAISLVFQSIDFVCAWFRSFVVAFSKFQKLILGVESLWLNQKPNNNYKNKQLLKYFQQFAVGIKENHCFSRN